MTFWPLFLLSVRALNSHAGPLLDQYELDVELPEPQIPTFSDSFSDYFPFRQLKRHRREADRYESYNQQYGSASDNSYYSRSDQGTASYYPHQGHQLQDTVQRSHQDVYPHQQFQQQPLIKKKRKTFSFALPFISLRFKKFGIEFSEYN